MLYLIDLLLPVVLPTCYHLRPPESLRHHAAAIAAQGVTVDSSVTLPCGDVAWVAQHKVTRQRWARAC